MSKSSGELPAWLGAGAPAFEERPRNRASVGQGKRDSSEQPNAQRLDGDLQRSPGQKKKCDFK